MDEFFADARLWEIVLLQVLLLTLLVLAGLTVINSKKGQNLATNISSEGKQIFNMHLSVSLQHQTHTKELTGKDYGAKNKCIKLDYKYSLTF